MILSLLEVLSVLLPILLGVAFMTILERKVMGSMQRRIGPNIVGYYGVLQPFSDALKLIVKELVIPAQSNKFVFVLAPILTLLFSLLGWAVFPFGSGLVLVDFSLGILYSFALSSIGVLPVFLAGWSANSKYAFLGSLRSTAQMISYELVYSSIILLILLLSGTYSLLGLVENQQAIWYIFPLLPAFTMFFISILAETNRTPFDLVEAESELVAGFFTEHSSVIFVFFFLGEYSSIVLMSGLSAVLFLGGYNGLQDLGYFGIYSNILESLVLGLKTCLFCFMFVWVRATLPRLRYDQLMVFNWCALLPIAVGLLILVPSLLIAFDFM